MSNYKFSKLIKCNICGKSFRGKSVRNSYNIYICSGRSNNGKNFCPNNERVKEEDLIFISEGKDVSEIKQIVVDIDNIKIEFKNGYKKIWSNLGLQYEEMK